MTQLPDPVTEAAFVAMLEFAKLASFNIFVFGAVHDAAELKRHGNETSVDTTHWLLHKAILAEMTYVRIVDNFLIFVTDLLATVYRETPEALRSSEQETLQFILQHADMPSLVRALAEKKVEQLSYKSMRDLDHHIAKELSFELFAKPGDRDAVIQAVEIRNVIVHARGIIGPQSARKHRPFISQVGKNVPVSLDVNKDLIIMLAKNVSDIDARAGAKFKLSKYTPSKR